MKDIKKSSNPTQIKSEDKNRCCIILKYTQPKSNNTIQAPIRLNNKIIVNIQDKKALVKIYAFLLPQIFYGNKYKSRKEIVHCFVLRYNIDKAFLY